MMGEENQSKPARSALQCSECNAGCDCQAKVFFIVGTGRSGTTLLQTMLMQHSAIRIPPETQFFEFIDPAGLGFDDPLNDEQVGPYTEAFTRRAGPVFLDVVPGLADEYLHAVRNGIRDAASMFAWITGRMTTEQSGTIIGEKSPQHWMHTKRIIEVFPDARFIHLTRDPRDVTAALLDMPWWKIDSPEETARYCASAARSGIALHKELGDERYLHLLYEDLVANPHEQLAKVCSLIGVDFEDSMLKNDRQSVTIARGAETAWKSEATGTIVQNRHGRYKLRFNRSQRRTVEAAIGADLLNALGYPPDDQVREPRFVEKISFRMTRFKRAVRRTVRTLRARVRRARLRTPSANDSRRPGRG